MSIDVKRRIRKFPRERIAMLPTPIHRLDRLSAQLNADIWIVRDDMTGIAFGGNKVRKLEFLLAEARKSGCDTILTTGANQSNHCRLTTACCARLGMEVHLVLSGAKPAKPSGNLLLDTLMGAKIHHVDSKDWSEWNRQLLARAEQLRAEGRKPFAIPVGGSVPTGALGYVSGAIEMRDGLRKLGIEPQAVYLATSSAGTQAGLITGTLALGWDLPVIGIAVAKDEPTLRAEVADLARGTAALLGTGADGIDAAVHVDAGYIGAAYAERTAGGCEAVELMARAEGLFLDYVYTGKAMAGLIDHIRTGRLRKDKPVLFLHTGGNVELFE